MTFDEVKKTIEDSRDSINLLAPAFGLGKIINEMLRRLDIAIKMAEGEELEPLQDKLRKDVNCSLDCLLEAMIGMEYSDKERDLIECIILIYNNFNELYSGCIERPYRMKLISLLIAASRSLEESIYLNSYLFGKVRSWFVEESETTLLSQKYYNEYMTFLKEKNHDEDYSIRCE